MDNSTVEKLFEKLGLRSSLGSNANVVWLGKGQEPRETDLYTGICLGRFRGLGQLSLMILVEKDYDRGAFHERRSRIWYDYFFNRSPFRHFILNHGVCYGKVWAEVDPNIPAVLQKMIAIAFRYPWDGGNVDAFDVVRKRTSFTEWQAAVLCARSPSSTSSHGQCFANVHPLCYRSLRAPTKVSFLKRASYYRNPLEQGEIMYRLLDDPSKAKRRIYDSYSVEFDQNSPDQVASSLGVNLWDWALGCEREGKLDGLKRGFAPYDLLAYALLLETVPTFKSSELPLKYLSDHVRVSIKMMKKDGLLCAE